MNARHHILMVGCTAPSHIYPSLALIRELVSRGHRVGYAVGEALAGLVEPTGAEIVRHPSLLPLGDAKWPDDPGTAMRVFLDEAIAVLPRLTARYDDDRPDLLLYDIGGLAAPVLAARYGVPALQLSPTLVAWDGYEQDMAETIDAIHSSPSGRSYHAAYNAWLRENGIDADAWDWLGHPEHILALIPRAMQPQADRVPEQVRFVGPCLDPVRLADTGWTPPGDGRRVLLVSFGTAYTDRPEVYRACVEAFAGSDWHVVLAVGRHVDPSDLGPLPAHGFEVHRVVPQLAVLAAASAFITHAGMGGCAEALWFGVPTVAIPQAVDQFGNAARLAELGVGRHLPTEEVTPATLREAVESVAGSAEVAARLAAVRAELHAQAGIHHAANAVESYLP
ncbi:UDP glycosyltransferase [Sphaerisporangium melleum]|uniref:UDP glycosyltransferase n=1 Tax=Sphaerisporangium melleum TaxID=321316 RepID=A0A917RRK5_9ACTN|nr:macrolide family glycosyltransferase [Sphaerisporangium melleum]GGL20223.1 UDP glycosyltransferase [Sphaerisporangium melleum]GII69881.1 UDP glycosyltransferase [Sphaerisporangium melleum]